MPRCSFNSALKNCQSLQRKYKENRIYIRGKFTGNLLYCFHTAGVLHIFMLYNLLGPGISLCSKSEINIKRNQIVFYSQNSYYKVYLKALKIRNCNG